MLVTLVWTRLWIEFTLSVKICLSGDLWEMRNLTRMIASEARRLMLNRNLLLFLRVLTMSSISHSAMDIASNTLLISIRLILWLFLHIVSILLIPILRLHYIIIIYMFILIQSLFLSSIMSIVNLISDLWIVSTVAIHLVRALNHVNILMIAWNVVRLKMIFFFKDVDIFVCSHNVGVGHRIIKILFVVRNVLLSWLKNVLDLCF